MYVAIIQVIRSAVALLILYHFGRSVIFSGKYTNWHLIAFVSVYPGGHDVIRALEWSYVCWSVPDEKHNHCYLLMTVKNANVTNLEIYWDHWSLLCATFSPGFLVI